MTTIVYKNGILASDTMVTVIAKNPEKDSDIDRTKQQETKIYAPANLLFEGAPILALGLSGNTSFIDQIQLTGFQFGSEAYFQNDRDINPEYTAAFKRYLEVDGRYAETGLLDLATFLAIYRGSSGYFSDYTNDQIIQLKKTNPDHPIFESIVIKTTKIGGGIKQKNAVKKPLVPPFEEPKVKRKAFSLLIVTEENVIIYDTSGFYHDSHVFKREIIDGVGAVVTIGSGGRFALFLNRIVNLSAVDLTIAAAGFDLHTGFDFNYIDVNSELRSVEKVKREDLPEDIILNVMKSISDEYLSRRLFIRARKAVLKRRVDIRDVYPNHDLKVRMTYDAITERLEKEKLERELRIKIQNEIIDDLNNLAEDVNTLPLPYRRSKQ